MEITHATNTGSRLTTVKMLPQLPGYDWLTEPALRHLIFQARSRKATNGDVVRGNGLQEAGAIVRIGRKVLLDLDRFDEWVDRHRAESAGA